MSYEAKVLTDSVSPTGVRLTTMQVTFPRLMLSEFNTHRVFSRNSSSSRAVPTSKRLKQVLEDPFVPSTWGKNQKGMHAEEELTGRDIDCAAEAWLSARDSAVKHAQDLLALGIHKQTVNRLLEPFAWQTVIVTATEWSNFYALRLNRSAQPEFQKIAEMMRDAQRSSDPVHVDFDDWHLPFVETSNAFDLFVGGMSIDDLRKVSAGRCARVSYLTHDGHVDPTTDDKLQRSGHMSPLEHVARPMTLEDAQNIVANQMVTLPGILDVDAANVFCGNLRGWVSLRKTILNEDDFSKRES